jgi:hypothetical protein
MLRSSDPEKIKNSSMALVVLDKTKKLESKYFAGDPATTFHEMRRFLFMQGVETKLYSAARVPAAPNGSIASMDGTILSVDNAFFSEFRSMVSYASSERRLVINTLIFILRVFIDPRDNGDTGLVQIMLNHLHDGIFELNEIYGTLCRYLDENNWIGHKPSADLGNSSLTSCMIYQHEFKSIHDFSTLFHKLRAFLVFHNLTGSNLPLEVAGSGSSM